jgi:D-alanyl-D-alanine carboxypeptidase (penicillin-binding protein 5/6)
MAKLMTIEMLFEALDDQRVQMDTSFGVSDKAVSFTALGGSTMYLQQGDRPTVAELIKGMIVNSGNDACTVVAEGLEGSEEEFARKMTERAKALGLEHSTFANSSGWPDPNQRMSMRDLGMLSAHIITTYPELYAGFADTEYDYKDRAPANANNRNPLLKLGIGADGLKTGHTQEAGYGLVGSVKQGDRVVVAQTKRDVHVAARGLLDMTFEIAMPEEHGPCTVEAELNGEEAQPVRSVRRTTCTGRERCSSRLPALRAPRRP